MVKSELAQKISDVKVLEKELQKSREAKDQYQEYFEKLKAGNPIILETVHLQESYDNYRL